MKYRLSLTNALFPAVRNIRNVPNVRKTRLVTFRVSCRPREMYCGHARLCVCLCVCPRPHSHTIARTRM